MKSSIRETAVLREVEVCLGHHGFFVIPRGVKSTEREEFSIWHQMRAGAHVGVVWRNNTGGAKIGRHFVSFGVPGSADYVGYMCGTGQMLSIEVKRPGGRMTPDQTARHTTMLKQGCLSVVVNSYEQCREWIEKLNAPTQRKK